MRCPIGTIALTLLVRLVLAAPVTATTIGTGDILVSNWASDGIDRFVNGQCAALPYPNIQHGYLAQDSAFALWGAMALRWTVPMWAAILAGAILGGGSRGFAWKQAMPSLEETRLRVELRYWISSGETARDNFIHELGLLRLGHHNAQIATHRARQIEQWRERLGAAIAQQTVLSVAETTAFVMSTRGDRISDSIGALQVLLRDWRSFMR